MIRILLILPVIALAAFNPIPTAPVNTYALPQISKGALVTSNGSQMGESTVCADDEILVWDSADADGVKCEAKPTGGSLEVYLAGNGVSVNQGVSAHTPFPYGEEIVDNENAFDDTTNVFTAPRTGFYLWSGSYFANAANIQIGWYVNLPTSGATAFTKQLYFMNSTKATHPFSGVIYLTAGDTVFLGSPTTTTLIDGAGAGEPLYHFLHIKEL